MIAMGRRREALKLLAERLPRYPEAEKQLKELCVALRCKQDLKAGMALQRAHQVIFEACKEWKVERFFDDIIVTLEALDVPVYACAREV